MAAVQALARPRWNMLPFALQAYHPRQAMDCRSRAGPARASFLIGSKRTVREMRWLGHGPNECQCKASLSAERTRLKERSRLPLRLGEQRQDRGRVVYVALGTVTQRSGMECLS